MTRLDFKAGVILLSVFLLISMPVLQPLALAEGLAVRSAGVPLDVAVASPKIRSTGPEIAGAGLAGAGAASSIDPVIVRNVLIGLLFIGLFVFSTLNESD